MMLCRGLLTNETGVGYHFNGKCHIKWFLFIDSRFVIDFFAFDLLSNFQELNGTIRAHNQVGEMEKSINS